MSVIKAPERFGRWTVLSNNGPFRRNGRTWIVQCDCGTQRAVIARDIVKGKSTNCGCVRKETVGRLGAANTRHGMTDSKEFRAWIEMRRRCRSTHRPDSKNYAERGITVCPKWNESFDAFLADVGPCPHHADSLDRHPNNNGNYEPGNVRWATRKQQERNKRTSRLLTVRGETMTAIEVAEKYGIPSATFYSRLQMGWSAEDAALKPVR